jgi:hypothetical protein
MLAVRLELLVNFLLQPLDQLIIKPSHTKLWDLTSQRQKLKKIQNTEKMKHLGSERPACRAGAKIKKTLILSS